MNSEVQQTHYEGCWDVRGHHACALEHIKRLTEEIKLLGQDRKMLLVALRSQVLTSEILKAMQEKNA